MKTRFLTLVALVLVMVQGYALPVDSVRNSVSGLGVSNLKEYLGVADGGSEYIGLVSVDDFERMDGKTGISTLSSTKKEIHVYQSGNSYEISYLDFGKLKANSASKSIEIVVKTKNLKKNLKLSLSGKGKDKYSLNPSELDHTKTNTSNGVKVTITFKPGVSGTYSANLDIKETGYFLGIGACKKTISLKGKVYSTLYVDTSSIVFTSNNSSTFKVKCVGAGNDVVLQLMGVNKDYFKVSPSTIKQADAGAENKITVTCKVPYGIDNAIAYISVYCKGEDDVKLVHLTYTRSGGLSSIGVAPADDESVEENVEHQGDASYCVMKAPSAGIDEKMNEMMVDVRIFAEGETIIIETPEPQSAIISDLSGHARSVSLQVGRNEIPVNSSGVYVVRVGDKSVKLMLR